MYVVESRVVGSGGRSGTARIYVATEERAVQLVADGAANGVTRTYRPLAFEDMPPEAQLNAVKVL